MTLLTSPRPASVRQPWPRLARCRCGVEILVARDEHGHPVHLERAEVLPPTRCFACHGRGTVIGELRHVLTSGSANEAKAPNYAHGPVRCGHCNGSGWRGERLNHAHVLVHGFDGRARPFTGDRTQWEAGHRRHRCTHDPGATCL